MALELAYPAMKPLMNDAHGRDDPWRVTTSILRIPKTNGED